MIRALQNYLGFLTKAEQVPNKVVAKAATEVRRFLHRKVRDRFLTQQGPGGPWVEISPNTPKIFERLTGHPHIGVSGQATGQLVKGIMSRQFVQKRVQGKIARVSMGHLQSRNRRVLDDFQRDYQINENAFHPGREVEGTRKSEDIEVGRIYYRHIKRWRDGLVRKVVSMKQIHKTTIFGGQ